MAILFLKGTSASYESSAFTPQSDVFYYLTDTKQFYLGDILLSNGNQIAELVQNIATNAADIAEIQTQLAKIENDESVDGSIRNIVRSYIDSELSTTSTNVVQNKVVTEALNRKVESEIVTENGTAKIFNEASGGGAKFEHTDGSWSYVGVNDGGATGLSGQIYTVVNEDGKYVGTRLNMTKNGFYYLPNSNSSAFTVEDEIATKKDVASASGSAASKTVYLQDESAGQDEYAKVYKLYQGADASDMSQNTLVGTMNIAKDKVVKDANIVTITFSDGKLYDGTTDVTAIIVGEATPTADDAGKYIKIEIQNVTNPLYVAVEDLVDIYTAQAGATQVQLTINENNVISAALVAGGVGTTELADGAVTADKLSTDAKALFDEAGAAQALIGSEGDSADTLTLHGLQARADAAVLTWGEF